MTDFTRAQALLYEFKGDRYLCGAGILEHIGEVVAGLGQRVLLVRDTFPGSDAFVRILREMLSQSVVTIADEIPGAKPNAPREDMFRIVAALKEFNPAVIISFGGGSTIDATKAAVVLHTLDGAIDDYFGTGLVTRGLKVQGRTLTPHIAIQTAASSAAHLTKYANITDMVTGQKKLIVDEAIIPTVPVFDYTVTYEAPAALTMDGALDGISHVLEVLYGAVGKPDYAYLETVAEVALSLVLHYLPRVLKNLGDVEARQALCLATDLGGYAIMLGGTNGGHLTSFSLVDILSHGRACALMNPYYTVFFAPAIEAPLRAVGHIYRKAGFLQADLSHLHGRALGVAVAEAMFAFARHIGFPTRLDEVPGFTPAHIERALAAAKDPQLRMKLQNMPVPLTADMVDAYMGPILEAAVNGNLAIIQNV